MSSGVSAPRSGATDHAPPQYQITTTVTSRFLILQGKDPTIKPGLKYTKVYCHRQTELAVSRNIKAEWRILL